MNDQSHRFPDVIQYLFTCLSRGPRGVLLSNDNASGLSDLPSSSKCRYRKLLIGLCSQPIEVDNRMILCVGGADSHIAARCCGQKCKVESHVFIGVVGRHRSRWYRVDLDFGPVGGKPREIGDSTVAEILPIFAEDLFPG